MIRHQYFRENSQKGPEVTGLLFTLTNKDIQRLLKPCLLLFSVFTTINRRIKNLVQISRLAQIRLKQKFCGFVPAGMTHSHMTSRRILFYQNKLYQFYGSLDICSSKYLCKLILFLCRIYVLLSERAESMCDRFTRTSICYSDDNGVTAGRMLGTTVCNLAASCVLPS